MLKSLHRQALVQGLGIFLGLYFLHIVIVPLLGKISAGPWKDNSVIFFTSQLLGVATCLVSGFWAGRVAGRRGFLHGLLVASMGMVVTAAAALGWAQVFNLKAPFLGSLFHWMFINGAITGFAGMVGQEYHKPRAGKIDGTPV